MNARPHRNNLFGKPLFKPKFTLFFGLDHLMPRCSIASSASDCDQPRNRRRADVVAAANVGKGFFAAVAALDYRR
jgi:hypothetical protein